MGSDIWMLYILLLSGVGAGIVLLILELLGVFDTEMEDITGGPNE